EGHMCHSQPEDWRRTTHPPSARRRFSLSLSPPPQESPDNTGSRYSKLASRSLPVSLVSSSKALSQLKSGADDPMTRAELQALAGMMRALPDSSPLNYGNNTLSNMLIPIPTGAPALLALDLPVTQNDSPARLKPNLAATHARFDAALLSMRPCEVLG
ncbi:hypothetical protein ACLOJK_014562, partial [Asimina triloba]